MKLEYAGILGPQHIKLEFWVQNRGLEWFDELFEACSTLPRTRSPLG